VAEVFFVTEGDREKEELFSLYNKIFVATSEIWMKALR